MTSAHYIADLATARPTIRLWVRGVFRLPDGHRTARRVRSEFAIAADDDERKAVFACELIEELEHVGYDFPEGHAVLVEVLGIATG